MNICCECEHYRRAIHLPYTNTWIEPTCRSIDVRRKHKSIVTGVPGDVYCEKARGTGGDCVECPHWSEKRPEPAPTKKRSWYRRLFRRPNDNTTQ